MNLKKLILKTCCYFDDIIKDRDIHFVDILLDEKKYENVSVNNVSYKTSTDPKPLRIMFNKIDGFVRVLDCEIKHFVLFDYGLFHRICDKIKYLISEKKKNKINKKIKKNFEKKK